jgi:hypothetical protein
MSKFLTFSCAAYLHDAQSMRQEVSGTAGSLTGWLVWQMQQYKIGVWRITRLGHMVENAARNSLFPKMRLR